MLASEPARRRVALGQPLGPLADKWTLTHASGEPGKRGHFYIALTNGTNAKSPNARTALDFDNRSALYLSG
jgi:hypothetical protein